MIMTPLIQKAIVVATKLHEGQVRKGSDIPYIIHPVSVAIILSEFTDNESILCAGLLHDVLEDVKGYREADMRRDFGDLVTDLVLRVSEKKDPNIEYDRRATWRERKEGYLKVIKNDEKEAVLICTADKLHNLSTINSDLEKKGLATMNRFNAGPEDQLWYYREVVAVIKGRLGDSPLASRLGEELVRLEKNLTK